MDGRDCVVYDFRYDDHIGIRIVHTDVRLPPTFLFADFFVEELSGAQPRAGYSSTRRNATRLFITKKEFQNFFRITKLRIIFNIIWWYYG